MYTYGNPDPRHCYYIDGLDTTGLSKAAVVTMAEERGIQISTGYPVDVAHLFRIWFMWGFWGSILQITLLAIYLPLGCTVTKKEIQSVLWISGSILQTLSCCSGAIWFLLGFFWRFSRGGRTAAGE